MKGMKIPRLPQITIDDLKDPARLDRLFWNAVSTGIIKQSQAQRLQWFAAAERALAVATQNPCALFISTIKNHLWPHITNEQEDLARINNQGQIIPILDALTQ